jgi:hypothetical protein
MPHVTFIHGIANKPPKDKLLEDWISYLAEGGLSLEDEDVTSSMVYWADVMYPEPETSDSAYESVESDLGTKSSDDDDMAWAQGLPDDEQAFVDAMRSRLGFDEPSPGAEDHVAEPPSEPSDDYESSGGIAFEAVPLPWFIKRRVMKRLLKDVYYYLFNKDWTHATNGDTVKVQDHIRDLFIQQMNTDAAQNSAGAHVVVSHSMGTVISYDCLKHVDDCPSIANYMTVGCPLGLSEVHDNFPAYNKKNAFPSAKVGGDWVNVYDRLDPVAFDSRIANDYQKNSVSVIEDQKVKNGGAWRHSSWKYFGQTALCDDLRKLLDL